MKGEVGVCYLGDLDTDVPEMSHFEGEAPRGIQIDNIDPPTISYEWN